MMPYDKSAETTVTTMSKSEGELSAIPDPTDDLSLEKVVMNVMINTGIWAMDASVAYVRNPRKLTIHVFQKLFFM